MKDLDSDICYTYTFEELGIAALEMYNSRQDSNNRYTTLTVSK